MKSRIVPGALALLCALSLPTPHAQACGGMFCNASAPVVQTAEEILYVLEDDGGLTMTVRINFTGEADEFAWVLPVPTAPTIGLGSAAVFDLLEPQTRPTFEMQYRTDGRCALPPRCSYPPPPMGWGDAGAVRADAAAADALAAGDAGFPGTLIEGEVGPYETVVIGGASATEIHTWLTDHGYDLLTDAIPILDEYVTAGYLFVALRLRQQVGVEEIQPVSLSWDTGEPCLPIRLTRIATAANLPIIAHFLASARATPRNYSVIERFESRVLYTDTRPGFQLFNYRNWASAQIDLMGGQAFIVEYGGATPRLSVALPAIDDLAGATPEELVRALRTRGYLDDPQMAGILARFVAPSDRYPMDPVTYHSCLESADVATCGAPSYYDAAGLIAAADVAITTPRRIAQGWLDSRPYTTRLYTELSAPEMTLDPEFVIDSGLPDMNEHHVATEVTECSAAYYEGEAPVRIDYETGTERLWEGIRADATRYCRDRGGWVAGTRRPTPDGGIAGTPAGGGGCRVSHARSGAALGLALLGVALALTRRRAR
jgi:hypothetical protein